MHVVPIDELNEEWMMILIYAVAVYIVVAFDLVSGLNEAYAEIIKKAFCKNCIFFWNICWYGFSANILVAFFPPRKMRLVLGLLEYLIRPYRTKAREQLRCN